MATVEEISAAPPCVAERYVGAVSTSSLIAPDDWHPTDAYVLVASGLGRRGLGGDLMRLRSAWSRSATPMRAKLPTVGQIAAKLPQIATGTRKVTVTSKDAAGKEIRAEVERTIRSPDITKAKRLHAEMIAAVPTWYDAEIRMLKNRMHDMPKVRDHLCIWLFGPAFEAIRDEVRAFPSRRGQFPELAQAETVVAETLLWWLDDNCPSCDGTRWLLIPGTNRHSGRACPECGGTGKLREPHGAGQKMIDYMNQCIVSWRASTSDQLATMSGRKLQSRNK